MTTATSTISVEHRYSVTDSGAGDPMDVVNAAKRFVNPNRPAKAFLLYSSESGSRLDGRLPYARRLSDSELVYPTLVVRDSHSNTLALVGPTCGNDQSSVKMAWRILDFLGLTVPIDSLRGVSRLSGEVFSGVLELAQ